MDHGTESARTNGRTQALVELRRTRLKKSKIGIPETRSHLQSHPSFFSEVFPPFR